MSRHEASCQSSSLPPQLSAKAAAFAVGLARVCALAREDAEWHDTASSEASAAASTCLVTRHRANQAPCLRSSLPKAPKPLPSQWVWLVFVLSPGKTPSGTTPPAAKPARLHRHASSRGIVPIKLPDSAAVCEKHCIRGGCGSAKPAKPGTPGKPPTAPSGTTQRSRRSQKSRVARRR